MYRKVRRRFLSYEKCAYKGQCIVNNAAWRAELWIIIQWPEVRGQKDKWPEVRGQKDKQGSTKHYTEN